MSHAQGMFAQKDETKMVAKPLCSDIEKEDNTCDGGTSNYKRKRQTA
jgi:6-phosphogluconate dehydrogenase (decarboxylating)